MGETANHKPGRMEKWREKRRSKKEERRRVRTEKALDAAERHSKGAPWGAGPMSGAGGGGLG